RALGPEVIEQLHRQVLEVAKRAGVTHGRRFRIDTTVVETNVHYPTDSSLLQDGVRVLTRTLQRAGAAPGDATAVRDRRRSIPRRCLAIRRQSRTPATRPELITSYRRLMAMTRAVVRDASTMIRRIGHRLATVVPATRQSLQRAQRQLQTMRPLVERILRQTRARLLGGDTHVADKVMSVFDHHTEGIRKAKIATPTEFGKLVTIQEAEHQVIPAYEVHAQRPADKTLWVPALDRHRVIFGRPPDLAAGDRGFASTAN